MTTTPTTAERQIVSDLYNLFDEAKGDHAALASVRGQIAAQIDSYLSQLAGHGIDTDALLDEIGR